MTYGGLPVSSHRSETLAYSLMTPLGSALSSPPDRPSGPSDPAARECALLQASASGMVHSMPSVLFLLAKALIGSTKYSRALLRLSLASGSSFRSSCQNFLIAVVVSPLSLQPCGSLGIGSTLLFRQLPEIPATCTQSSFRQIQPVVVAPGRFQKPCGKHSSSSPMLIVIQRFARERDFLGKYVARASSFDHPQCQEHSHNYFILREK